jgi:hypothetical protein
VKGGKTVMKKLAWIVLACFILNSCATYTATQLPQKSALDCNQRKTICDVCVGITFLDRAHVKSYFDSDLIEKGCQPIYVTFENHSDNNYHFTKSNISIPSLTSKEASEKGERNTVARAAIPGIISLFVLWPLAIWAVADGISSFKSNKKLRADFESKEIADGVISKNSMKCGIIYAPIIKNGEQISITLTEVKTQERLKFTFIKAGIDYSVPEKPKEEETQEVNYEGT